MNDPDVIASATIDRDLSCARCGYNLRGLDGRSVCPECGCEIAKAVWAAQLEPAWFGALSRGALLIGLAIAIDGIGVLYTRNALHLIHPIATLVGAFGAWMFFSPHPRDSERRTLIATLGRVVCIVAATIQLQVWLIFSPTTLPIRAGIAPRVAPGPFVCAMLLVWALEAGLVFWRAGEVARRMGDRAGAVQANVLVVLASASLAWCAYGVATLPTPAGRPLIEITGLILLTICAVWSLIFFAFFFVILRKRAGEAGVNDAAGIRLA